MERLVDIEYAEHGFHPCRQECVHLPEEPVIDYLYQKRRLSGCYV